MITLAIESCRSCGAKVIWLPHERTGKAAPIDLAEDPQGNVVIDERRRVYIVLKKAGLAGGNLVSPRHTSHFATCTEAASWRRP